MSPTDLANQQLLSAWVSAGAAVVQAVGAITAITISVLLARDSRRRELRIEAATAAQTEAARVEAGHRAEAEKFQQRERLFNTILALAQRAVGQIEQVIEANTEVAKLASFSPGVTQRLPSCETFLLMVPVWSVQTDDPSLIAVLHQAERILAPYHMAHVTPDRGERWIEGLQRRAVEANLWLDRLTNLRPSNEGECPQDRAVGPIEQPRSIV